MASAIVSWRDDSRSGEPTTFDTGVFTVRRNEARWRLSGGVRFQCIGHASGKRWASFFIAGWQCRTAGWTLSAPSSACRLHESLGLPEAVAHQQTVAAVRREIHALGDRALLEGGVLRLGEAEGARDLATLQAAVKARGGLALYHQAGTR